MLTLPPNRGMLVRTLGNAGATWAEDAWRVLNSQATKGTASLYMREGPESHTVSQETLKIGAGHSGQDEQAEGGPHQMMECPALVLGL